MTFSEDVQNVDTTDFSVSGTSATVAEVAAVSGSESQYDVIAGGGDLANYNGTVTLSIASGHNITDKADTPNDLTNTTPGTNQSYVVDNTAPRITSIVRRTPGTTPTNADSLTWRITFDEDLSELPSGSLEVSGSSATPSVTIISNSVYDVTVTGGDLSSLNAEVSLGFKSSHGITDEAGNGLVNLTPTGANEDSYVVDNAAPTFSSAAISGAALVITFNEDLLTTSTLRNSDFEVTKGASNAVQSLTGTPSISGAAVTLTLSTAVSSADDDIKVKYTQPSAAANQVRDGAGNPAATFAEPSRSGPPAPLPGAPPRRRRRS